MSNKITVNLEWETSENGMYFTTVFGTVKKTWEQIVGPIFGFEIKDNGWAKGEKAMHFAETFTVKSYEKDDNETTLIVNAKYMGTVQLTASKDLVQVETKNDLACQHEYIWFNYKEISYSEIVGG